MAKELNIIHFNDVYEINERKVEPVGGASRFATAVKSFADLKPIVLFSGDVFNPSVTSTITKGKHMPPILNKLGVAASVVGNHEFDFGPSTLTKNIADCTFPWILSNVVDKDTNGQLVGSLRQTTIDWNGIKVGLIGLAEKEWLDTINQIYTYAKFLDFVEEGKKLSKELKDAGADIIICLAHMRMPNAEVLADGVPEIDLILNGHDHFYEVRVEKNIVLSGSEFRNLSVVKAHKGASDAKWKFEYKQVDITTAAFQQDPEMLETLKGTTELINKKLAKVIGEAGVVLDAKNAHVRTQETNLGNLIADIMREEMKTDAASVNGGNIRSDNLYGPGEFTLNHLIAILPFENFVVTIKINGAKFKEFLEAAVSRYPSQDGRFAQVSGVKFSFDPDEPVGSRVKSIEIGGKPIDNAKLYSLALGEYIAQGNDGYECLKGTPILTDKENASLLSTLVRKYFIQMEILAEMDQSGTSAGAALSKWRKKKTKYTVKPEVEGRITNLKPPAPQK